MRIRCASIGVGFRQVRNALVGFRQLQQNMVWDKACSASSAPNLLCIFCVMPDAAAPWLPCMRVCVYVCMRVCAYLDRSLSILGQVSFAHSRTHTARTHSRSLLLSSLSLSLFARSLACSLGQSILFQQSILFRTLAPTRTYTLGQDLAFGESPMHKMLQDLMHALVSTQNPKPETRNPKPSC